MLTSWDCVVSMTITKLSPCFWGSWCHFCSCYIQPQSACDVLAMLINFTHWGYALWKNIQDCIWLNTRYAAKEKLNSKSLLCLQNCCNLLLHKFNKVMETSHFGYILVHIDTRELQSPKDLSTAHPLCEFLFLHLSKVMMNIGGNFGFSRLYSCAVLHHDRHQASVTFSSWPFAPSCLTVPRCLFLYVALISDLKKPLTVGCSNTQVHLE